MLIAKAFGYRSPNIKELPEDKRDAFIANWPGLAALVEKRRARKETAPEDYDIYDISSFEYMTRQRITLEEAHAMEAAGIELELEGVDGTMLTKMADRRPDKYGAVTSMEIAAGQVVQIAVPDLGLLQINETDWMEDACTEQLQMRLDDGWRILAVCPPNAQRRPDYILGRHNPEKGK